MTTPAPNRLSLAIAYGLVPGFISATRARLQYSGDQAASAITPPAGTGSAPSERREEAVAAEPARDAFRPGNRQPLVSSHSESQCDG